MMKKILSAALVPVMLLVLTACGSNNTEPDDPGGSNGSGILDTGDDAKKPDPGPSEPTPGGQETPPVGGERVDLPTVLQVKQGECWLDEWDENYNTLYTISWDQLILAEESAAQFPALSEALAELNAESQENGRIVEENYRPLALEAAENSEFFGGYTYTDAYTILRADDRIFSIRGMTDEYTGGPHPMTWYYGVNIDSATGAAVTLGDVLTETESLTALLVDTLRETYPHVELEGAEETLAAYAPEDFFWTMDYQSITIYMPPYELAPYAVGALSATIWFDEHPELFREEYTQVPEGGFARPLAIGYEERLQGDNLLMVSDVEQEYGSRQLMIFWNGKEYREENGYAFAWDPYLVCLGDGETYLYVDAHGENDYRTIYVYDLNGDEPVLVQEYSGDGFTGIWDELAGPSGVYYRDLLTDPAKFVLGRTIHVLGTMTGTRTYSIDPASNAMVSKTDYYDLPEDAWPIVSTVELEVLMLPQEKRETLPVGTTFHFLRSDGESYADMALEDGRECRIEVEHGEWSIMVNGKPDWECFEELLYAG